MFASRPRSSVAWEFIECSAIYTGPATDALAERIVRPSKQAVFVADRTIAN